VEELGSVYESILDKELTTIRKVVEIATAQVNKAKKTGDLDYFQAAALSLHNFYMGIERIFEKIAKQIDGLLPTGANSHQELLNQMAREIPDVRPPVIQVDTLKRLDEYRRFRHVATHRYGFELEPHRIQQLIEELPICHNELTKDMQDFLKNFQLEKGGIKNWFVAGRLVGDRALV